LGKRSVPNPLKVIYAFLADRDGNKCWRCGAILPGNQMLFEIDHKNGNKNDWRPANLGLAHRSCNGKAGAVKQHQQIVKRGKVVASSKRARAEIDVTDPNASLVINKKFHDDAKEWMENQVIQAHQVGQTCEKKDLIYSAAERFHLSGISTQRYLLESCSSAGILMETKDADGNAVITLKPLPPDRRQMNLDGSYQTEMDIENKS
jgi:hypothetical protein